MKNGKFRFWMYWTLLSLGILPLSYLISLMVVGMVHSAFGFNETQMGTHLSQTVMQMAGGAVIGLGTGLYQRLLLVKLFKVQTSWIYSLMIGFAVTELIACIVLWLMDINRYELRFIEFNPLPEAIIFAFAGLIIGIFQWTILKRYFSGSGYWLMANTLGWGIWVSINVLWLIPGIRNSFFPMLMTFALGSLLYGAITGGTLMWIMKPKGIEP